MHTNRGGRVIGKTLHLAVTIDEERIDELIEAVYEVNSLFDARCNFYLVYDSDSDSAKLDVYLSKLFAELGMPASLKGYRYLKMAINLYWKNPVHYKDKIASKLYSELANMFNTNSACVEKSIRHAISIVCDKGDYSSMISKFGNTISKHTERPANLKFIERTLKLARENVCDEGSGQSKTKP